MKFAYLIMAHNNPNQLKKLLRLLDLEENEIYLHLDKKSAMAEAVDQFRILKHAKISVYVKYKVAWGSFTQTKCQIFLLEEAIKNGADYYHLLSGSDLPIKTGKEIQDFFQEHNGEEFIHFEQREPMEAPYMPFYNRSCYIKSNRGKQIYRKLDDIWMNFQKNRGIKRELYKGANWFSITHKLAAALIKEKKKALHKVKNWHNSDEYILQTFFMEGYKGGNKYGDYGNNHRDCLRYIDWGRGKPYVWRMENYDELMNSDSSYLFARKFDENVDGEVIEKIYNRLQFEGV